MKNDVNILDPRVSCVPSDEEMYRIFKSGSEDERLALETALRVYVSRVRKELHLGPQGA